MAHKNRENTRNLSPAKIKKEINQNKTKTMNIIRMIKEKLEEDLDLKNELKMKNDDYKQRTSSK